jgi:ankyrin repeat protein
MSGVQRREGDQDVGGGGERANMVVLNAAATLNMLPPEIKLMILEALLRIDAVSLTRITGVNRHFRALATGVRGDLDVPDVYKTFLKDKYGSGTLTWPDAMKKISDFLGSFERFPRVALNGSGVIDFRAIRPYTDTAIDSTVSPVFIASEYGLKEVLRRLLKHDKSGIDTLYNRMNMTPLMVACSEGHLEVVQILVENGAAIDQTDSIGTTSLMVACSEGHLEVVQILVENGADIDQTDSIGTTSLMVACTTCRLEIVKFLLKRGAAVTTNNDRDTLLHAFARLGHNKNMQSTVQEELADLLLGLGVERDARNNFGNTAIRIACRYGFLIFVKKLLEAGAPATEIDGRGETLLMAACNFHSELLIQLLIEAGTKVNAVDKRKRTAIRIACEKGDLRLIKKLFDVVGPDGRVDVNQTNDDGETLLMTAASGNDYWHLVQPLLKRGALRDAVDNRGRTAIRIACDEGCDYFVRELLEAGADVNETNDRGETLLMTAAYSGNEDVARLLLDAGADKTLTLSDRYSKTASDIAFELGNESMGTLIETYETYVME